MAEFANIRGKRHAGELTVLISHLPQALSCLAPLKTFEIREETIYADWASRNGEKPHFDIPETLIDEWENEFFR